MPYKPSGGFLLPPRMRRVGVWSNRGKGVLMKLGDLLPPVKIACVLMLLVLTGALVACATPSPPVTPSSNPAPPRLSEPLPEESYSSKVQKLLQKLREAATAM